MAKNSNGQGSFRHLPSGNWSVTCMDGYRDDGKKNMVSFTAPTKAEARIKLQQYFDSKTKGGITISKKMPFSEWADAWYADYCSEVQPSTYGNYKYTLRHLKDYFKDTPMDEILPIHINRFLDSIVASGYSKSQISKCRAMLIQIFESAKVNNLTHSNPARDAKRAKMPAEAVHIKDAFNALEISALKEHCPDNLMGHSVLLMIGCGLRVQELLALQVKDIAKDGSTVDVSKAIKMVDGSPTLGKPKSARSKRIIPVPADYRVHAIYLRNHGGKAFIWCSTRDSLLYSVGTFRKKYYRMMEEIPGVRPLSPHCCRHTYSTQLQANGVPMDIIARLMGHESITTTDGYTHTQLQTLADAVSHLNHADKAVGA